MYPGLKSHPQHDLAKRQMTGFGGMLAFEIEDESGVERMMNNVQICTRAVSLGSTDTLIENPASMTHKIVPSDIRQNVGISNCLMRMSIGIEDVDDIISDLDQALKKV